MEMCRKMAWRQSFKAILRAAALAHGRPQKIRDEGKKCPRSCRAWTLCQNRGLRLAKRSFCRDTHSMARRWRGSGCQWRSHSRGYRCRTYTLRIEPYDRGVPDVGGRLDISSSFVTPWQLKQDGPAATSLLPAMPDTTSAPPGMIESIVAATDRFARGK
jgi:hypothetical protein